MLLTIFCVSVFLSNVSLLYAHQPYVVIKASSNKTVVNLSDASVSHAFYGEFVSGGEEVLFELTGFSGRTLKFSLLIPDQLPEKELLEKNLPEITLIRQSQERPFLANVRVPFYEPYSQMNLIRVISHNETLLEDSKVSINIRSNTQMRYVFSIGDKEIFSQKYASGDTEELNQHGQLEWYVKTYGETEERERLILIPIFFAILLSVSSFMFYRYKTRGGNRRK